MKKILSLCLLSFFISFGQSFALELGDQMPKVDQRMLGVDGKEYAMEDFKKGKGTLVVFTCNHCPYVKAWEERLAKIGNDFNDDFGVVFINSNDPREVDMDSYPRMQERSKRLGHEFPFVVDFSSDMARKFGAEKTPDVFLFDKTGKLVYKGAPDDSYEASKAKVPYLRNALTALKEGKKIETASTKSVGCSIKFRES